MTRATPSDPPALSPSRRAFLPPPTVPLVYFAFAHVCLTAMLAVLVVDPALPGAFVYHPRALALVHLVTIGWISGSILGAIYIVGPLALGVPMRAGGPDAVACASFVAGTVGIVLGFWHGRYDILGAASPFVVGPIAVVGTRVALGLRRSKLPAGVSLHVILAFVNMTAAGLAGLALALNRLTGTLPFSPVSLASAHAHVALLGWAMMMIFGVAYRLIPMFVPAAMPTGPGLAVSAVLLQVGAVGLAASLLLERSLGPWLAFVIGALISFFVVVRRIVRDRRPRPPDLPARDWSTWHTHLAMAYLFVAALLGAAVAVWSPSPELLWTYGAAGVLGFVVQMVVGIEGRLLPMYLWYRALELHEGALPERSVHQLIVPSLSLAVLVSWLAGLPLFTAGLVRQTHGLTAAGAAAMLLGTTLNAVHVVALARRAGRVRLEPGATGSSPTPEGPARP